MAIDNIIRVRSRYVKHTNEEHQRKGYQNNIFYNIKIKQKGEGLIIKKDEDVDNSSRMEFKDFDEFLNTFDICSRY